MKAGAGGDDGGVGVLVAVVKSRMVVLVVRPAKRGACSHGRGVNGGGEVAEVGERHERCHGNAVVDPGQGGLIHGVIHVSKYQVSLSAGDWASYAQAVSEQRTVKPFFGPGLVFIGFFLYLQNSSHLVFSVVVVTFLA